jgi:hypothetical protein
LKTHGKYTNYQALIIQMDVNNFKFYGEIILLFGLI